jgi:Fur family ferric uptake transcriptional regulator
MEDVFTAFRGYLKKRGLRYTREREAIVHEIFTTSDHFDVDELFVRMRKKTSRGSKASIYRTIRLLLEAGLIVEVFLEDGHMHYEPAYGRSDHCHLRCNKCRTVVEVTDPRLAQIEREIAREHGFKNLGHKLEINGLCPKCRSSS